MKVLNEPLVNVASTLKPGLRDEWRSVALTEPKRTWANVLMSAPDCGASSTIIWTRATVRARVTVTVRARVRVEGHGRGHG